MLACTSDAPLTNKRSAVCGMGMHAQSILEPPYILIQYVFGTNHLPELCA
jgi:hypothetical protein